MSEWSYGTPKPSGTGAYYWTYGVPTPSSENSTTSTKSRTLAYKVKSTPTQKSRSLAYNVLRPATVTVRIYPSVDGTVEHYQDNLDFTALRGAAGNGANSTATTDNTVINASSTFTDKFIKLERQVFSFDTSVIGSGSEIISATLSIHNGTAGQNTLGGTPSMCVTGGTLANHTALASGDYDAFTDNEYATRKLVSTFAYNTRYNYDLNAAGLAYISKTDHTIFFFRNSWDVDNSFGGTWASGAYCQINTAMTEYGDSTRPYLDVTYRTSPLNKERTLAYKVTSTPATISKSLSYAVLRPATVTVKIYPTVDGSAQHWQDTTFSTLRNAAGNGASSSGDNDYALIDSSSTTNQFIKLQRGIFSFDSSVLGSSVEIISASLWFNSPYGSLNELGGTPSICLTGGSLASPTAIVSGDYDGFTDTEYATRILLSSIGAGWKEIPLNSSGLNYIEKTGYTIFYLRISWDVDNSFGGTWVASKETANRFYTSESANKPYLEITYRTSPLNKERTLAYKVTSTPATKSRALAYKVLTVATEDRTLAYKITSTPATISRSLAYALPSGAASYTAERPLAYKVEFTPTQKSRTLAYSVLTRTTEDRVLAYRVTSTVTPQRTLAYKVLSTSTEDRTLAYNTLTLATEDRALAYAVKSSSTPSRSLAYAVKFTPAEKSRTLAYEPTPLAAPVIDANEVDYDIEIGWVC